MLPYWIPPTRIDIEIANVVSEYTNSRAERAAELLTWGADEHVLLAVAAGWWLYCRRGSLTQRKNSDHLLLTTLAVSLFPHLLKNIFDQRRPDRLTVRGHLRGVPIPSGHAMHVGALASAATVLPPTKRNLVWALGAGLALSRVVLLAHWASDVVAGLALGALAERLLRPLTGYGASSRSTEKALGRSRPRAAIGEFT